MAGMGSARNGMTRLGLLAVLAAGLVAASTMLLGRARPVHAAGKADTGIVDVSTTLGLEQASAAGTGILLSGSGLVLTNNHVIRGATGIRVRVVATGKSYQAKVLGYSVSGDIALLKLRNASGLTTAPLGHSSTVRVGDRITAVGNAGGVGGAPSVTTGNVTALHQSITVSDQDGGATQQLRDLIQNSASVQPGDSGGAILNASGRVVGVITAASGGFRFQGASGGFAIPIDDAISITGQIRARRSSSTVHVGPTAFLGVLTRPASGFGDTTGVVVAGVVSGTAADKAGVQQGDVIDSFAGHSVTSPTGLAKLVLAIRPGTAVTLRWLDGFGNRHSAVVRPAVGPPQ
jgi:S1-C subfamily serine protease